MTYELSFATRDRPRYITYGVAIASVILSLLAAIWLKRFSQEVPFLLFTPAVILTLWYGGLRPALVAVMLSAIAVHQYVMPPIADAPSHVFGKLAIFVVTMGLASWIIDRDRTRATSLISIQQRLIESTHEPMLVKDANSQIMFWNMGAERLYGWSREEAYGKTPEKLLHAIYPRPLADLNRECRERGWWNGVLSRTAKDGRVLTIESSWNRYVDSHLGEFILQSDHNITEQLRSIQELNTVNRSLRAISAARRALVRSKDEKELLDTVVSLLATEGGYTVAWVAIPQEDGTVAFPAASGDALKYLSEAKVDWKIGTEPAAVVLRTGEECLIPDVQSCPGLAAYQERLAAVGMRSGVCLPLKVDGKTIGALNVAHQLPDAFLAAEIRLLQEIAADLAFGISNIRLRKVAADAVQAQSLLEQQLRQAQKLEAVGQLAGGIAHDFNNLLMVIMAQNELLLDSELPPKAANRAIATMQAAKKAADLTRQLLAFSRKQVLQPSVLNLNDVVGNMSSMLERLLGEDIDLRTVFADDLCRVQVDRSQLEQVVMNLAVNARDAMPEGGRLTIETTNADLDSAYTSQHPVVPPGEYAMLAVSDTGTGIPPEIRDRIFEPFFTTKPEGKGTGLGLATVYGIVKQSGGFIWTYSELGKGTSFKVYFPKSNLQERAPLPTAEAPARVTRSATILVVEDDDTLRTVITDFLSSAHYQCLSANSIETATQIVLEHRDKIDLLLTDVILKGGNGRTMAKALAEKGCHFPVIFMSGYAPTSVIHQGILDEGTHFLQKPFSRTALLNKVEQVLSESASTKD